MTPYERLKAATAYAKEHDDYHDSDGVNVIEVFLAGHAHAQAEIDALRAQLRVAKEALTMSVVRNQHSSSCAKSPFMGGKPHDPCTCGTNNISEVKSALEALALIAELQAKEKKS